MSILILSKALIIATIRSETIAYCMDEKRNVRKTFFDGDKFGRELYELYIWVLLNLQGDYMKGLKYIQNNKTMEK